MAEPTLRSTTYYVLKNFGSAQHALVTGEDELRERLRTALNEIGPVSGDDVPEQFAEELEAIIASGREWRGMAPDDLKSLASRIDAFYEALSRFVDTDPEFRIATDILSA